MPPPSTPLRDAVVAPRPARVQATDAPSPRSALHLRAFDEAHHRPAA